MARKNEIKYLILKLMTNCRIYDNVGLLYILSRKYPYLTLNNVGQYLLRLERNGDVRSIKQPRTDDYGNPCGGRPSKLYQITRKGFKKVKYLQQIGRIY